MFDSEDRMKAEGIDRSPKKRLARYIIIGAVSFVVIAATVLVVRVMKL